MPEPKYVIAMGACTIIGGMLCTDSYSYPPKPEAGIDAIAKLRRKISREIYEDRIRPQRSNRRFTTNHKFHSSRSMNSENYDQGFLYQPASTFTSEILTETFFKYKSSYFFVQNQINLHKFHRKGHLSAWLVRHWLIHRSLSFDYQGIETLQIKFEDWHSIAIILYVYAPSGLLASAYHFTRIEYGVDQPEEVCIKVFVSRRNPRIPSVFWV
ncbi:hypothetical protein M9H77_23555 [Catharanthus roseus]|uniref:Uncharacterized protein n=1 Tax=Catharanthus roseus TaxID=4058 RepID=A0ACC0AW50_CATRO|nr:hypothetical protein M9H77_23555 [Catharanthus roseus]